MSFADFARTEARFAMLARTHPESASALAAQAQADIDERWRYYSQLAGLERSMAADGGAGTEEER
jgi:pyruvate-ferredoxin/flavodoxin oxidoreductase